MNNPLAEAIKLAETQLLEAMLKHDVPTLSSFLHDELLFLIPAGELTSKESDLDNFRLGKIRLSLAELMEIEVHMFEECAISATHVELKGSFRGQEFEGRFRYIRTWKIFGDQWKVIGGAGMGV